jgi:hypothetical protein
LITSLISSFVCFVGVGVYFARKSQNSQDKRDEMQNDEPDTLFVVQVSVSKELSNAEEEKLCQESQESLYEVPVNEVQFNKYVDTQVSQSSEESGSIYCGMPFG